MTRPVPRWLRTTLVLSGAAILLWITVGVTLTTALGRTHPGAALVWWPWGAEPKVVLAQRAAQQDLSDADRRPVLALLQAALAREPVNAQAARTLGLMQSYSDVSRAARTFAYAERLSRRDLPTELWLIENAVQRGEVRGALVHYDHALRTSRHAADTLLPTLVAASAEPAVAQALGPMLRDRPVWWRAFLLMAIERSSDPASLAYIVAAFRPDLADAQQHEVARLAVARIADMKRYDLAARLYGRLTTGRSGPLAPLRNGDFERGGDLAPLDWSFTDTTDLSASPERFAADQTRLELRVTGGAKGEAARQLLALSPGRYTLSGIAGGGTAAAPVILTLTMQCTNGPTLGTWSVSLTSQPPIDFRFPVPVSSNCPTQWLLVGLEGSGSAWMDKLALTAVSNRVK